MNSVRQPSYNASCAGLVRIIFEQPSPLGLDGSQVVFDVTRERAQQKIEELESIGWQELTVIPIQVKSIP